LKNKLEANRKLFGTPLKLSLTVASKTYDIPPFLETSISEIESRGLSTEGIGRIGAGRAEIDTLKEDLESGKQINFSELNVILLCDIVKLFLRDLPQPLIPFEEYDTLLNTWKQKEKQDSAHLMATFNRILNKLDRPNKALIRRLIRFWGKIAANESANKMTPEKIALLVFVQISCEDQMINYKRWLLNIEK